LPEVPVIVSVFVPGAAERAAVNVRMLVPVVGLGFHSAVTPLGSPEMERVTLPVNPYCGVTTTYAVPDVPCPMSSVPAERVNVGAKTPRATVVVADRLPDVPVIVNVLAPVLAVLLAESVSVLVFVVGLGEKLPVTPLGKPDTVRFTLPLNPYAGDTMKIAVADFPWPIFKEAGPARVKLGPWMESVRVVVSVRLPDVPVIVSVALPPLAVLLAVRVSVLAPVVEVGEKEAVTPLGKPETDRFTLPVNPY
jgi:hypothetical protein